MNTVKLFQDIKQIDNIKQNLIKHSYNELSLDISEYHELSETGEMSVGGIALTEGRHLSKVNNIVQEGPLYTPDILQKKANSLVGKKIFFDFSTLGKKHNPSSENNVGYVTEARYDAEKKGIVWKGVLTAKKIYNYVREKTIRAVSLGLHTFTKLINQVPVVDDLLFEELSLVQRGADKNASISIEE